MQIMNKLEIPFSVSNACVAAVVAKTLADTILKGEFTPLFNLKISSIFQLILFRLYYYYNHADSVLVKMHISKLISLYAEDTPN